MIAIITALREELAPLLRRATIDRVVTIGRRRCHVGMLNGTPVVLLAGGEGIERAERAACELLQRFEVSLLVGAGIAGAIDPSLRSGDVIVATDVRTPAGDWMRCAAIPDHAHRGTILSVDRIVASKLALADSGAHAVDTESTGWARAAEKFDVQFAVVRTIFDAVDDDIPAFIAADGAIDRVAIVRHAIFHPKTIPTLIQMRDRVRACSNALADFIARAVMPREARLNGLLSETSRTFALCIPLLGDKLRNQVTIAYLLFRIADTFEDASHWPVADRLAALDDFCALLCNPDAAEARRLAAGWHARRPSAHAGYMRLIADVPLVMEAFTTLPQPVREVMKDHVIRSARGMAQFVAMTEAGELQLRDMQQLRDYCYAVAGIVGEMCTEIFLLDAPQLRAAALLLRARAAAFGEGLQLVNILKDHEADRAEGRTYIPAGARRQDVVALARTDLELATEYTLALQSSDAPHGIIAFNALPIALARATLNRLESAEGATKITRPEVFRIMRQVNEAVAKGEPPLPPPSETPAVGRMRSMFSLLFE